ncbi:MAG: PAS domain-containing protein, partial [Alphaproteobacteria bacterium]
QSGESLLVRQVGARLDYLSPRLDGAAPLERSLDAATANLASAMAIGREGGFVEGRDYRGVAVLATSRRVAQTPWFVVEKVDRQEALGDSESQARRLATILLLGIALAAVAVMAAWRHGSSLRAATAAAAYRDAATRLAENRDFLRLLTDSQPNAIAIVGPDDRYSFANRRLAEEAGVEAADVVGKSVASVFGAATADPVMEGVRQARHENRVVTRLSERSGTRADGAVRTVQSQFIPLPGQSDLAGILVVDEDISQAISVQAERERQLRGLVDTLLSVVDRRDPFAQHHSARVARLAAAVSAEMGLDPATQRVAETAGGLMNLGKITVPAEILAKSEPLTNRELETVRESLQLSAELLAGIAFEGPVVETLRQVQERVDGRGQPEGRLGDQILVTARILATVNALVGLTSPRAHRAPMSIDAALDALMEETGTRFDRRVVAALISYLENHGGRAVLEADRPRRP